MLESVTRHLKLYICYLVSLFLAVKIIGYHGKSFSIVNYETKKSSVLNVLFNNSCERDQYSQPLPDIDVK